MTVPTPNAQTAAADPPRDRANRYWRTFRFLVRLVLPRWVRFRSRGLERIPPGTGALLVINHQSLLDPALVCLDLERPVCYLARDSLFRLPILGWMLRRDYAISISREAASSASIREAVARVDGGFLVGIFPEGTRSDDGSVGPLKPGFIALLRRSRAPVVPIGIAGAGKALPRGAWFIRRQPCRVVVAEPISAEEIARLSARGQEATLVETIRQRMAEVHREAEEWLHSGE